MGYRIIANSNKVVYGLKNFIMDKESDLESLPLASAPGSTVFCIEDSKTYMLNPNREWVEIQSASGSSSAMTKEEIKTILGNDLITDTIVNNLIDAKLTTINQNLQEIQSRQKLWFGSSADFENLDPEEVDTENTLYIIISAN